MPNTKYDQTSTIMSGTDWVTGRVIAFLYSGAVYDKTHQNLSQVVGAGAVQKNVTQIQNRAVGPGGEALGLPAAFPVTDKGSPYQVVLAWDRHQTEMPVLAFYDEDEGGEPLGLQNNGTFIVRPTDFDQVTGRGTWFSL